LYLISGTVREAGYTWSTNMRAKQSSTAKRIFSRSGTLAAPIPIRAAVVIVPIRSAVPTGSIKAVGGSAPGGPDVAQGEGLLHDARNLMGALGLYCDLLALPGVLKPEHVHYADDLRLLGVRSAALMERLVLSLPVLEGETKTAGAGAASQPVSLRSIVERCSGLLEQVAGGRTIELSYGPAASALVSAGQEDVERVLVNLVRNAAAALDRRGRTNGAERSKPVAGHARGAVREMVRDRTADAAPDAVRIGVGLLQNRVGDPSPWPFRRVRLTVEDSGCGMGPEQLERLLRGGRAPARGSRGIGFCVVRELVAAGGGDLRVMSATGVGTRVQIEWPVATATAREGRWPVC
jgi:signal transduction histidine kinase